MSSPVLATRKRSSLTTAFLAACWTVSCGSPTTSEAQLDGPRNDRAIDQRSLDQRVVAPDLWKASVTPIDLGASEGLFGVHGTSSSDVWIIGTRPYHFDGKSWKAHEAALLPASALWVTATDDVWISPSWHFRGAGFEEEPLAGITGLVRGVWGVAGGGAWLVSGGQDATGLYGEIGRFEGTEWNRVHLAQGQYFHAITGSSASDIWVAGGPAEGVTRTWHLVDGSWTAQSALPVERTVTAMSGASASSIWAVGGRHVLHYDGSAWAQVLSTTGGTLRAVHAAAQGDVWVVGKDSTVFWYDGHVWRQVSVGLEADWYGVWGPSPDTIYLVGVGKQVASAALVIRR